MATYIPICFVALFKKVEWKPIVHDDTITLEELAEEEKISDLPLEEQLKLMREKKQEEKESKKALKTERRDKKH